MPDSAVDLPAVEPAPMPSVRPKRRAAQSIALWSAGGLLALTVMVVCFGFGYGFRVATEGTAAGDPAVAKASGAPDFNVLNEVYSDLKKNYIDAGKLDANALREGAIDGMIKAVGDPHMGYLGRTAFMNETDDVSGSFSGIGATIQPRDNNLVLAPLPNTPAEKAGIKPDDVLISVDGTPARGWNELEAVQKIRGPRGTKVTLAVQHASGVQQSISIQRDTINLDSVHTVALHDAGGAPVGDIGYVKIDQFTERTPQEMQAYLDSIKEKNYKGLIVDLRNNPGGVVNSVVAVAGDFVGRQPVVIVQDKDGKQQTVSGTNGGPVPAMPIAVLVNHNSASASEILSGALRDDKQAKLFGENTFGKGTENIFVPLKSDPGGISVTVGRWLTPSHTSIEGTGLKPDVGVSAAPGEDPNGQFNAVLYRALDYLQTGQ